jgi:hypothetical protein
LATPVGEATGRELGWEVDLASHNTALARHIDDVEWSQGAAAGAESQGVVRPADPEGGDDAGAGDDHAIGQVWFVGRREEHLQMWSLFAGAA